jgi:hypothetical protein
MPDYNHQVIVVSTIGNGSQSQGCFNITVNVEKYKRLDGLFDTLVLINHRHC